MQEAFYFHNSCCLCHRKALESLTALSAECTLYHLVTPTRANSCQCLEKSFRLASHSHVRPFYIASRTDIVFTSCTVVTMLGRCERTPGLRDARSHKLKSSSRRQARGQWRGDHRGASLYARVVYSNGRQTQACCFKSVAVRPRVSAVLVLTRNYGCELSSPHTCWARLMMNTEPAALPWRVPIAAQVDPIEQHKPQA